MGPNKIPAIMFPTPTMNERTKKADPMKSYRISAMSGFEHGGKTDLIPLLDPSKSEYRSIN